MLELMGRTEVSELKTSWPHKLGRELLLEGGSRPRKTVSPFMVDNRVHGRISPLRGKPR